MDIYLNSPTLQSVLGVLSGMDPLNDTHCLYTLSDFFLLDTVKF